MRNRMWWTAVLMVLAWTAPDAASGQCILANPSFEMLGSGGQIFSGWNQFGPVGPSAQATHGAVAAKATGPNLGGWDVAGFWQPLDSSPGEQWTASVRGWHSSTSPLSGQSRAILNIEWRDGAGNLISYESHDVADAATPPEVVVDFSVTSAPAPAGTETTHLLLAVLQGPSDPTPVVTFDEVTFLSLGPPTHEDQQWGDFPGGRTFDFGGRTWRVKGPGYYGPGPNLFSDDPGCVWVDAQDRLHMTIRRISGSWYSTEVTLEDPLGYGDYVFTTRGRLDALDPRAVLGLFIWEYGPCYNATDIWWNPYNEIDVEISRWGDPGNDLAQFVAQPWDYAGNLDRFDATLSEDELSSYAFHWLPDRVEFRSWRGGPQDEATGPLIHAWTYTGPHIPRPEQPRVHINFWQFQGSAPAADQEVILDAFTFVPEGGQVAVADDSGRPGPDPQLTAAEPNPFSARTQFSFTQARDGRSEVAVYDVQGRRVRTLANGFRPAGTYEMVWDGRDERGRRVASGVYLYRLHTDRAVETRRVVAIN